jgi:very-short-patch-repair endonuclease
MIMPFEPSKNLKPIARTLRKHDTWAEKLLWSWLRHRRFSAYKFRRQHAFGPYILDFFCVEAFLNIELDGSQHGFPETRKKDEVRDTWLAAAGVKVLRFWNSRLRREQEFIRETIWRELQARAPHPLPEYCRPMTPICDKGNIAASNTEKPEAESTSQTYNNPKPFATRSLSPRERVRVRGNSPSN